jgi:hypothetical protein
MLRIKVTVFLICSIISFSYAQDTSKKSARAQAYAKYKMYRYHRRHAKADSAAAAAAGQQAGAVKPGVSAPAQVTADKGLFGQYQFVLTKVYHYQEPFISSLWRNFSDTLNSSRRKLKEAQGKLITQGKTIDSLNAQVTSKNEALSRVDGIDILGVVLSKTTYNLIVWGLVAVFGITAIAVMASSGRAKREARYRTQLYTELEEEFKAFKTKANDKEKKLARELQTERNKLDDLLGK